MNNYITSISFSDVYYIIYNGMVYLRPYVIKALPIIGSILAIVLNGVLIGFAGPLSVVVFPLIGDLIIHFWPSDYHNKYYLYTFSDVPITTNILYC